MKTSTWIAANCKFAGGLAGTPHGDPKDGLMGYSRTFDLLYERMWHLGLKNIEKDAYVATFGLDKEAKPEHQIRISWANHDDPGSPAIKIKIVDDAILQHDWLDIVARKVRPESEFVIKTDKLHNAAAGAFLNTCQDAFHLLEKRVNRQLTDRGRWGLSL